MSLRRALVVAIALAASACGEGYVLGDDALDRADGSVEANVDDDASAFDAPIDTSADASLDGNDGGSDIAVQDVAADRAMDTPRVDIAGIDAGDCRSRLRALGVNFTPASATMGIADPINLVPPVNDVHFRYSSFTAADRPMLMDCRLALAVEALARTLRDRFQVTDVVHLGTYNYRCIAGTDPCRLSQHAYGLAIDLNAFRTGSGQRMTVTTDFVANGTPTCPPRATSAIDRALKEIACWMYDSRTFNIVLTPNYNAAHRDHYHADLTSGSHFVGLPGVEGTDPTVGPGLPDLSVDDE